MSEAFQNLSPEGKLQKIHQHIESGHPVPTGWVDWLLNAGYGGTMKAQRDAETQRANRLAAFIREKGLMAEYYAWQDEAEKHEHAAAGQGH